METKEVAIVEPKVTQKDLDDYLFGQGTKLTEQQKKMFYAVALRNNLDPFKREVYAIAYGNNFSLVTGYETYIRRAEKTGLLDGWEADFIPEPKGDESAYCTIHRKDQRFPITQKVWLKEFKQENKMWKEKPRTMLIKVAIATCFRRAFSTELAGIPYTADEMPMQEPIEQPRTAQDQRSPVDPTPTPIQDPKSVVDPTEGSTEGQVVTPAQLKRLYAIFKDSGKTKDQVESYLYSQWGHQSSKNILQSQYDAIIEWIQTPDSEWEQGN